LQGGGQVQRSDERYVARPHVTLGRVLAAAGRGDAEQSYKKALNVLRPLVKEFPESLYVRQPLAETLTSLADLLQDPSRQGEVEAIRREVIEHYEALKADFPEDPRHRHGLVGSYLALARPLCKLGRQSKAAEPYRKALELGPENPDINNEWAWLLATAPEPCPRDPALAVRLPTKAVRAGPKSADYRNTLGVTHYRNGDAKAAVAELEEALRLRAGGHSFDWFFLAMAHWRLGDRDQARTHFDEAVRWMNKFAPQDEEFRRFRAEAEALLADAGKP
jgi:tetratricopeptide (TPR) repeat protein